MPTFEVTDTQSGITLELTGDSPPTEQELEQIFASQAQKEPEVTELPEEDQKKAALEALRDS